MSTETVDFAEIEDLFNDDGGSPDSTLDTNLELDDNKDDKDGDTKPADEIEEVDEVNLDKTNEDENNNTDDNKDDTEVEEELSLAQELVQKLGFEFEDEFEDSVDGLLDLTKKASTKLAEQELEAIFGEYPEVKNLLEYLSMGGSADKFINTIAPEIDYSTIELNDDEKQHEMLVRQELMLKGYTQEDIEAELEDYKAGGILENKAKRALTTLKKHQVAEQNTLLENQQKEYEAKQREIETFWNGINDTISKASQFKGLNVPESEKKAFFDYLSKPVKDGKSQRDLDVEDADTETRLAIDYLIMKKFNLSQLVTNKANSQRAQSLRDRLKTNKVSSAPNLRTKDDELATL